MIEERPDEECQISLIFHTGETYVTSDDVAVGKLHQWTESSPPPGRDFFRFWYKCSQKKGVKGAISCM